MAMETPQYDVIVIGSGPGGEGAAMKAAKAGKRVAVVERHSMVGGGCTHWATIPSKALRHAIQFTTQAIHSRLIQAALGPRPMPSLPDLLRTGESVIARQVALRQNFYDRNNVRVVPGIARFIDPNHVEVEQAKGARELLAGRSFVIATGSRPYRPPGVDFNHPRVLDSDTLLALGYTPSSITIYGAGTIGCEYASMLRNLGAKVNLINTRDRLLSFLDDEIADALSYHLRDQGVVIRHNEEYAGVYPTDRDVLLDLKSGKKIKSDVLLWANGRSGNSGDMGLEALGIKVDSRGNVEVNADYQTAQPHIYAVGDVVGPPALAGAAYDQGRFAAGHICDGHHDQRLVQNIPTGIYTTPEISSIGPNERELTERKVPYEVGHALFKSLARAQITGQTVGMLKILFHRETLEVLGIHCFGDQASEIVHIGQAIMAQEGRANSLMYFVTTTFNYPTMAEAYRVAALNGLNRVLR
jgi:NAD(P) transhydrogenase